jgi:hypothetical protein
MLVLRGGPDGRSVKVIGDLDTAEFVELYADEQGRVVRGIGCTRTGDRYDPITDALEAIVRDRRPAADLQSSDVGLG